MMILQTGKLIRTRREAGFTLIELVLVMAILIVVLSMSGTSLTSFFKGRSLEAEGKRFLALTRHAQSRAVSEGLPMSLWIDTAARKYGLEVAASYGEVDERVEEFELGKDIEIEVTVPQGGAVRRRKDEFVMSFGPDGYLDETNPELIAIKEKGGEAVYIVPTLNRLNYEITTNNVYAVRR
jgi:type II secretion system protein H